MIRLTLESMSYPRNFSTDRLTGLLIMCITHRPTSARLMRLLAPFVRTLMLTMHPRLRHLRLPLGHTLLNHLLLPLHWHIKIIRESAFLKTNRQRSMRRINVLVNHLHHWLIQPRGDAGAAMDYHILYLSQLHPPHLLR